MYSFEFTIDQLNSCGVYKLTLLPTGDSYIGSTSRTFKERWAEIRHHLRSRHKRKISQRLIDLWVTYGEENFSFEIVEYTNKEEARNRELYWIEKLKPSLNFIKNPLTGEVPENWKDICNMKEDGKYNKRLIPKEEQVENFLKYNSKFKNSILYNSLYIEPRNNILKDLEKLEPFTSHKNKQGKIRYKLETTNNIYYFNSLSRFIRENNLYTIKSFLESINKKEAEFIWKLTKYKASSNQLTNKKSTKHIEN
jgi:group I intron endonuclease